MNAEELGRLDQFLLFGVAYDEGMTLDTLDCYLYAIAPSGPGTIMPSKWFPKVWGEESTTPPMEKIDKLNHIMHLPMRHHKSMISGFEQSP